MHSYCISGLAVRREIDLPGLIATAAAPPDVTIRLAPVPQTLEGATETGPTWQIAGDTLVGVGIAGPNLLAAGYSDNGRAGAVLYDVAPNGVLSGRWVAPDGGLGTEVLTPQ